jgi:hypothetical protein
MRSLLTIVTLLASMTANAAAVTWTVDNLLFSNGGSAYGSFGYDASTNLYSDVDITTLFSDGNGFANYQALLTSRTSDSEHLYLIGPGAGGLSAVSFTFAAALTSAGGTATISYGQEVFCDDYECTPPAGNIRNVVSGSVSAVPIPAAAWLFGSALAGLGWLRRKPTA